MKAKATDKRFFFEDNDFRVCFRPDKISYVDDPARVTRALHEEIEIKYFYEGSSTLLIGKETIEVQKGDLVVINPYEPHSTIRFGEERGHYRFLMMDLDFFMDGTTGGLDLRTLMIERGLTFKTLIRGDARLADIMRRMTEANESKSEYRRFAMRATMLELFSLLLAEYATRPSRERETEVSAPSKRSSPPCGGSVRAMPHRSRLMSWRRSATSANATFAVCSARSRGKAQCGI